MNQTTIHIPRSEPWLPPSLLENPAEIRHRIIFSSAEKRIFRKHKKIQGSRWAEMYRYVTMSVMPGRWKNETTPYLAGIMDASFYPSVRKIIICKAPQVGGTEAVLNCLGYVIDRDPGPALIIYPDELTAKENNQDRIQPMIMSSPRLKSYMTGTDDDVGMLRIKLSHMLIYMAWARSASRLSNKPIRYVIFDETDKYPETAGKRETDPISLGESRQITYQHNSKTWEISTPTIEDGPISTALNKEAQVIFDYYVTCPYCGNHNKMNFNQIEWGHEETPGPDGKCHSLPPEKIEAEKLAWYICEECKAKWSNYDRDRAIKRGTWRDRINGVEINQYLQINNPAKIGFHIPSIISPFVSLSQIAAADLKGRSDINKKKDYYNKHRAEPWKLFVLSKNEAQILASRCDLAPQTVPESAIALTCGVDVQKHGFWFVVRAWTSELSSWLIHYGFLETEEDVDRLIYETSYPVSDSGKTMRIFRAIIDTGGGKKTEYESMTEHTYYWLLKNRGRPHIDGKGTVAVWGSKGATNPLPGMLKLGESIISTPSGKKLPAALRLLHVDTHKAKDQYHFRLNLAAQEDTRHLPGAAFLHAKTGADYASHILAEEKKMIDKNIEEWVNEHQRPNHLFDADILAAACVEMEFPGGGLRLLAERLRQSNSADVKKSSPGISKSNWMSRK